MGAETRSRKKQSALHINEPITACACGTHAVHIWHTLFVLLLFNVFAGETTKKSNTHTHKEKDDPRGRITHTHTQTDRHTDT